ncbi:MAG: 1-deoxy-D-xylulose-5-phosphate reductoisomerase [Clostridia bacterium]|nr:1-deoxy-D-xylulose-5-phosphate reductoisomerase [Clostridia bacterium]
MTEKLTILGSTGSIGTQALDVVDMRGYEVVALTADSNYKLLEEQIRKYKPEYAALSNEEAAKTLRTLVADTDTEVLSGKEGIIECARLGHSDTVLNSIVGIAGLAPTVAAIEEGRNIALANKETLVAGGKIVMDKAKEKGVAILPVDSEHSAIFQCLEGMNKKDELKSIILTASGGPFFGKTKDELKDVTVAQALKHPNWEMGAKITVDSASMMNKGLELIEAVWLFDVAPDKVDIVVHRESIIHSLVEYNDNSVIAQLGVPDMRIPIQYALTYPDRYPSPVKKLNLWDYQNLTFYKPDYDTFRCLELCRQAISKGGIYPCVANGANEMANELFRKGEIGFLEIADKVQLAMEAVTDIKNHTLDDVFEYDGIARQLVKDSVK